MRIQSPTFVHGPQSVNAPHRLHASSASGESRSTQNVDQLDISHEADLASRVRELPEIRADRVASIKAQIASGAYETDEKLNVALDRLLDEIG